MMAGRTYLVDSDVFITARNLYYSFDICPGFWKSSANQWCPLSSGQTNCAASWDSRGADATFVVASAVMVWAVRSALLRVDAARIARHAAGLRASRAARDEDS